MHSIWTAFLLASCFVSFGQSCDTIDGKVRNCTDVNGLKQGYWEYESVVYKISSNGGYGTKEGCQYSESVVKYAPDSTGYFKDNQRIGTWKFYGGFIYNDKGQVEGMLDRELTYLPDGSMVEDRRGQLGYYYSLRFSADTSTIEGYSIRMSDTVWVNCISENCRFTLTNTSEITSFPLDNLAVLKEKLFGLTAGIFDRKIWKERKTNPNTH